MSKGPTYAQLTAYPKLFANCYWGAFRQDLEPKIIAARNAFAAEWRLKSWCTARAPFDLMQIPTYLDGFDHNEAYRTETGGIVCLTSPYHSRNNALPDWAMKYFNRTYPVYAQGAESYIAHFNNIAEVRAAIRFAKSSIKEAK